MQTYKKKMKPTNLFVLILYFDTNLGKTANKIMR